MIHLCFLRASSQPEGRLGPRFIYFGSERVTRCVLPGPGASSKQLHVGVHGRAAARTGNRGSPDRSIASDRLDRFRSRTRVRRGTEEGGQTPRRQKNLGPSDGDALADVRTETVARRKHSCVLSMTAGGRKGIGTALRATPCERTVASDVEGDRRPESDGDGDGSRGGEAPGDRVVKNGVCVGPPADDTAFSARIQNVTHIRTVLRSTSEFRTLGEEGRGLRESRSFARASLSTRGTCE